MGEQGGPVRADHPTDTSDPRGSEDSTLTRRIERFLRLVALFGGPLLLLLASAGHPETGHQDPGAAFAPVAGTYLGVHLVLVPAVALLAVGLYSLTSDRRGPVALLARVAVAVFAFVTLAYSSVAGLAAGIVLTEAPAGTDPATLEPLVDSLFTSPLPVLLAILALLSYTVAVVTTAVVLRRAGAPLPPLVALVGSTVAIYNHLGMTGVAGTGLFVLAAAWLAFGWDADATVGSASTVDGEVTNRGR